MPAPKSKGSLGIGCLVLFALPFAGFGVFALGRSAIDFGKGNWQSALGLFAFGIIFTSAGVGIVLAGVAGLRRTRRLEGVKAERPDEPWLWRDDWAQGWVKSSSKGLFIFTVIFALFWNGIAFTVAIAALPQVKRQPLTWLVLLFPLVGIGLMVWAFRQWSRWRRFGHSTFHLTTRPGVIGGSLAGVVRTAQPLHGATEIRVRLACLERDTSGDSTSERIEWEEEKILTGDVIHQGGIPVLFNIPFECRPVESISASRSIVWRLNVGATVTGTDFAADFEVPVFKTSESRPDAPKLPDPTAAYEKPIELGLPRGVRIRPSSTGGTEFHFAAARNKGAAFGLTVFTAIWLGAIVLMVKFKAPIGFPIVFGFFGLLMVLGVIGMWTGASRVVADLSGLNVTHWFCFISWRKVLPLAEVKSIEPKLGMSSGTTTYYDLLATTASGRKVKLATAIKGKKESEWFAREIQNALARR